ncbi:MAG: hypothetical protein HUJ62_07945, partial [Streptococcus gallolyticus]|nr:hypothetical protein [Streptococcus gallolyticus]
MLFVNERKIMQTVISKIIRIALAILLVFGLTPFILPGVSYGQKAKEISIEISGENSPLSLEEYISQEQSKQDAMAGATQAYSSPNNHTSLKSDTNRIAPDTSRGIACVYTGKGNDPYVYGKTLQEMVDKCNDIILPKTSTIELITDDAKAPLYSSQVTFLEGQNITITSQEEVLKDYSPIMLSRSSSNEEFTYLDQPLFILDKKST